MEEFILVNGNVKMNNHRLFIKEINNKDRKTIKLLAGFSFLIFFSLYKDFEREDIFINFTDYVNFGIKILGLISLIYLFYEFILLRKSNKKLIINEISKIKIDSNKLETNLTLIFSNNRKKYLKFRTLEKQTNPFIKNIKKRNSRVIIEEL